MARLGYARVSSAEQDTALQIRDLDAAGCERIYRPGPAGRSWIGCSTASATATKSWCGSWTGSDATPLLELLDTFKAKGIKFRFLRDGITTGPDTELGGAMAQAMITIISAFAQLERDQLSERTRAGMAVAPANGPRAGRREVTRDDPKVKRAHELKAQGLKPADIGRVIGVGRATLYRYLSLDPG